MAEAQTKPKTEQNVARLSAFDPDYVSDKPQSYYDEIKRKFAEERDLRLKYRPEGTKQYTSDFEGELARFGEDPYGGDFKPRPTLHDTVEVLFTGGGFSALLASARLREYGIQSIRIVERGADVGGTWYWNRYPGAACDVPSYDYLPLLDELHYVPKRRYARAQEIFEHCQRIARYYNLYELAVFQTTVTSTVWDNEEKLWHVKTDRGDHMKARFVICANGPMAKPKLSKIQGIPSFKGHSFHSSRWDYDYTGADLEKLADKRVAIIGTGATAVQIIPEVAKTAKALYVFQRTPSCIDIRNDWETDPEWARKLKPGWQKARRERAIANSDPHLSDKARDPTISREEKIRRQENANIDYVMRLHRRIEQVVKDPATAESLKPWYMYMCKRPTFHDEFLDTFNRPNVHLIDTHGKGVTEVTEKGPVFDGKVYEVDLIVYATGFEVQKTGIYNRIIGDNGVELNDKYAENGIRTLLGIHSHNYPNLFVMAGYQASFQFNITDVLQVQGDHIAACIKYVREHGYRTIDVTPEMEEWWVQEVINFRGKTDRNKECTPGYYNFEGEFNRRQDGTYNGGFKRYIEKALEVQADMEHNFIFGR
jgi:cation diffusion facilitator CzcD-associated flavoprotein CzcO